MVTPFRRALFRLLSKTLCSNTYYWKNWKYYRIVLHFDLPSVAWDTMSLLYRTNASSKTQVWYLPVYTPHTSITQFRSYWLLFDLIYCAIGFVVFTYMIWAWLLDSRIGHKLTFEYDTMNVRSDGTMCASYCGAFRTTMYL